MVIAKMVIIFHRHLVVILLFLPRLEGSASGKFSIGLWEYTVNNSERVKVSLKL